MAKACANFMGNACDIHVLQLVWGWAVMNFYQWSPQKAPGASQLYLKNVLYYRYHSAHMSGNVRHVEMITFHKRTWLVIYFFQANRTGIGVFNIHVYVTNITQPAYSGAIEYLTLRVISNIFREDNTIYRTNMWQIHPYTILIIKLITSWNIIMTVMNCTILFVVLGAIFPEDSNYLTGTTAAIVMLLYENVFTVYS